MFESLVELLPELLYTVAAAVLTSVGVAAELGAIQNYTTGHQTIALWLVFLGAVALYAGVELGREKVLPAVRGA